MTTRSASHRPRRSLGTRRAFLLAAAVAVPTLPLRELPAQLISIKTVPVAEGEQFAVFPSRNAGMGGLAFARDDTLLDPFRNPAAGARIAGSHFFASPVVYSISSESGGGRSLPLGVLARTSSWFGGLSVTAQQIEEIGNGFPPAVFEVVDPQASSVAPTVAPTVVTFEKEPRHNTYAHAMAGRQFESAGVSVGASAHWAGLNIVDGVELLYAGSNHIRQRGHAVDLRVGALKEWGSARSLEGVLVHNRYRMTHDVTYLDPVWNPTEQRVMSQRRIEHNPDRTNTWGAHFRYAQDLTSDGWRAAAILTANRMSHPKIPNYEIMSIPRDPGYSYAWNFGVGVTGRDGPATLAMELVYEPIWSETWADAAQEVQASDGRIIPAGGKTIENDFEFSNVAARIGVSHEASLGSEGGHAEFQLGLALRSIHYWLAQRDNVAGSERGQEEQWLEWTPTWGVNLRLSRLEVRYTGRQTNGNGRPGVGNAGVFRTGFAAADASGRSIIVAPSGPLTLDEVRVTTHQVSISFPLR